MKGLLVNVLRNTGLGDATNGGLSATHAKFVLVGEGIPEVFEENDERPVLVLVKRHIGGKPYLHAEPAEKPPGMVGPMFGGNYIVTSDGRFPNAYPIPVHDRFETPEDYDRYSR